ncbi:hypothetical protein PoB_000950400 [Plakobranchus ocellatus]|uniref:Uncharacterized protein n=1 Tax=Plakobranchus ocellatus TaxID=259542 RepID=A0AAV3YLI3_9GAST|nr:hypothetical protein PoB_000950400 [Plakobranchus ocellatus]
MYGSPYGRPVTTADHRGRRSGRYARVTAREANLPDIISGQSAMHVKLNIIVVAVVEDTSSEPIKLIPHRLCGACLAKRHQFLRAFVDRVAKLSGDLAADGISRVSWTVQPPHENGI